MAATFELTNGTTTVNLLADPGFTQQIWRPQTTDLKGGGVWSDAPMAEGRQLVHGVYGNVTESITLVVNDADQDGMIRRMQNIRRLLKQAEDYWLTEWQNQPVWLKAKAGCETNARYALVYRGRIPEDSNPYSEPFTGTPAAMERLILTVEHGPWLDNEPGSGTCAQVGNPVSEAMAVTAMAFSSLTTKLEDVVDVYHRPATFFEASNGYLYLTIGIVIYRDTTGVGDAFAPVAAVGGIVWGDIQEANDGNICVSGYNAAANTTHIYESSDDGATFASVYTATVTDSAQPSMTRMGDGRLLCIFRDTATYCRAVQRVITGIYAGTWLNAGFPNGKCHDTAGLALIGLSNGNTVMVTGDGVSTITTYIWTYSGMYPIGAFTTVLKSPITQLPISIGEGPDGQLLLPMANNLLISHDDGVTWDQDVVSGITYQLYEPQPQIINVVTSTNGTGYLLTKTASDPRVYFSQSFLGWTNTGWTSPADVGCLGMYAKPSGGLLFAIYDDDANPDDVFVYGMDEENNVVEYTSGRTATCSEEVFVTNHHLPWNLTHVKLYDASAGTYTDIFPAAAFTQNLLPSPLAANDAVMFACAGKTDGAPFSSLAFDLAQAFSATGGFTAAWQYSSGAGAWTALTVVDHTNFLSATGVNSVHWTQPSAWTSETYDSIKSYWIRMVVTAVSGTVTLPTQQNRDVYAVSTPYLDIDDAQVPGDIEAIAQTLLRNMSAAGGPDVGEPTLYQDRAIVGLRTMARGADFTPYLNATDRFSNTGIAVYVGTNTTFAADVRSATGRAALYNPTGVETATARVTWQFTPTLMAQYYGTYHMFARVRQSAGAVGNFTVYAVIGTGSGGVQIVTDSATTVFEGVRHELLDLGQVQIPASDMFNDTDSGDMATISLYASALSGTGDLYIYDVILMPVDEWAGDFIDLVNDANSVIANQSLLDVDSISHPKRFLRSLARKIGNAIYAIYQGITNGPNLLQANKDQRLWFLTARHFAATGTHTGANDAATLTDASGNFVNEGVVAGNIVYNITDGSSGTITARDATTVTATLAGGVGNDWDTGDYYYITPSDYWVAQPEIAHTGRVNRVARYLSMRGDR